MDDFRYVLREQAAEYQARISLLANNLTLRERAKQLVSSAYKRQCESELGELFQLFDSVQAQLQILEDEEELRPAACGHGLCAGCLAHYCVSVVKPHRKCVVPCPHAPRDAGGCEALMPREAVVRAIAEDEVATRVFTEVEVEAAATGEGEALLYCPHCSEPMTRPPDGLLPPNRPTRCPACRHKFCAHCRTAWHKRRSCARHQAYLAGGGPAAPGAAGAGGPAAVAALRRCGVRTCPGCRQGVVKASGCNHMTCVCGSEFCYVCGKGYLLGRKLCMCDKFGAAPEAPTAVDYDALIRRVEPMPESEFAATDLDKLMEQFRACGHGLCAGCLAHYCVSVVKPHRKCVVPCPHAPRDAGGCEALMPREAVVRAIAEDEVATRVFTEVEVEAAATGEGEALMYCPHCSEPMTRPPDGLLPPNRPTRCPACRHKFCAHCRTAWHRRRSCARHQAYLAGGGPAAPGAAGAGGPAAVAALRRCGVRTCPGCRQGVVKASGCNHMTCVWVRGVGWDSPEQAPPPRGPLSCVIC
ncbi:hypothetical protein HYH03_005223 [Edaphochlamys debaryana]|uniref:RBR-type E3 ubiquitin transferase n=1 Tax=Edaphochlamys debaryana TaxID=47281 RepID=A0A835Y5P1_9CHLO|nr:hypothetical protein HYH03_005223 [Edaphochlamys debaryana]|eukprot:KAG2496817.1 hypothetical protein HYH03_005223 [Edaphochlamys debaryana]